MKRLAVLIILGGLAAAIAGAASYTAATRETTALLTRPGGEMEWLRHEFQLSDAQYAQIQAAHEAYRPTCDKLCERIAKAHLKLRQLIDTGQGVTPEVQAALAECAAVELDCREAMLKHVQTVGAYMNPESAARFRRIMEQRIVAAAKHGDMMFAQ